MTTTNENPYPRARGPVTGTVSLTAPATPDDPVAIERRIRLAQVLRDYASVPLEAPPRAGGYEIPISPLAGMAKLLTAYGAAKERGKAEKGQSVLTEGIERQ